MKTLETKIPPPIVGLLFALLIWAISAATILSDQQTLATAIVLLVLGISFAIAGGISFRAAATTVNPLKPETASSLVTSGIFKYTRNPMYVGLSILLLAWTTYLAAAFGLVAVLGFMAYI